MKPADPETRRDKPVVTYVCQSEQEAIQKLGTDYTYVSVADAVRQALALLINTRHPELAQFLRKDLQSTP
jgi:hypothetical protein